MVYSSHSLPNIPLNIIHAYLCTKNYAFSTLYDVHGPNFWDPQSNLNQALKFTKKVYTKPIGPKKLAFVVHTVYPQENSTTHTVMCSTLPCGAHSQSHGLHKWLCAVRQFWKIALFHNFLGFWLGCRVNSHS